MSKTHPRPSPAALLALAAAAVSLLLLAAMIADAAQPAGKAAAPPAAPAGKAGAPPAAPAPGFTPAPKAKMDPKLEPLAAWIAGIFPWGPGETSAEEIPGVKVRGRGLIKVTKTFTQDARANDQTFAILEEGGRTAVIGDPFLDQARLKAPQPVRTEADLAPLQDQVQKYLRGRARLVLDPAGDRPGLRGIKVMVDSGYGAYEMGGFVSADDGALLILGRAWDRKRSFPEQRKELMKLAGAPVYGPADATVTVVEYSDMQCGFCKKRTADWEPLLAKIGSSLKIKRYFKSFPLSDHPWAFRAAAAGRCFFEKDPALFFRWKSNVYNRQEQLTVSDLDMFALDFATANDLGEAWFKGCYLKADIDARILADLTEGFAVRVRATPTYMIDGVAVSWFADGLMEDFLRQTYHLGRAATGTKAAKPAQAPKGKR